MKRRLSGCFAMIGLAACGTALAAGASAPAPWSGWVQIADGVYQKTDAAGVTRRLSLGAGGARYDRALLQQEMSRFAGAGDTAENRAEVAALAARIDAISGFSDDTVEPADNDSGTACGAPYHFDSDFAVGIAGANLVARAHTGLPFGGGAGVTVSLLSTGKIYTPVAIGDSASSSGFAAFATAIVNWDHFPITSSSCTATSSSTIDYSGTCVDHVGLTVTYPTCQTGAIP